MISSLWWTDLYNNSISCFNLVIEVLLISSSRLSGGVCLSDEFQSRNRGSFDFKVARRELKHEIGFRFNLVIEVLLISSFCGELTYTIIQYYVSIS